MASSLFSIHYKIAIVATLYRDGLTIKPRWFNKPTLQRGVTYNFLQFFNRPLERMDRQLIPSSTCEADTWIITERVSLIKNYFKVRSSSFSFLLLFAIKI
ncbi:MAG: hypothetical protein ACPL5I_16040 [Thermodesulfobacteriota bacterium]